MNKSSTQPPLRLLRDARRSCVLRNTSMVARNLIRQALPQLQIKTGLAKLIFDLGDLLERHIRKEERELFPLFESQFKTADAERIGRELKTVLMM